MGQSMNRQTFFDALRGGFTGALEPQEVTGTEAILDAMAGLPIAFVAYALATAWHETAGTMQPIKERGGTSYFFSRYDPKGPRPDIAKRLGNTEPGDGARFPGRGLPQTTGRANYAKASAFLGVDCIANPDLLLEPRYAAPWMVHAMLHGLFTGKRFADYLPSQGPATYEKFVPARRIVNGLDRAADIAGYAVKYQDGLQEGGWA
jgi:putative chitinase